jgi:hypothetical protein
MLLAKAQFHRDPDWIGGARQKDTARQSSHAGQAHTWRPIISLQVLSFLEITRDFFKWYFFEDENQPSSRKP